MKQVLRFFFTAALVLLVGITQKSVAQQYEYLDVPQGYETLNLAVEGDTTAAGLAKSQNRVYRLERGGVYLLNGHLYNTKGAPLRIFAAEGTGPKPLIIMAVDQTGANDDFAYCEGDAYFKNLYISGIDNIGKQNRYTMAIYGDARRIILDGVHVDQSRQSHFRTYGTNAKIFFYNCEFRNSIDLVTPSNGRFFDARGLMPDTILWQNNTVYLNSQRMFRLDGAIAKNLIFDHNTFYQNAYGTSTSSGTKQGGGFEIAKGVKVRVTNNIFQDMNAEGMRHARSLNPPDRQPIIYVDSIKADTLFTESSRDWVVRNNAYGWAPSLKAFWATIDTLKAPVFISPYGDSAFFRNKPNFKQLNNFEEYIQFVDAPPADSLINYVKHRFKSNFDNKANPDPRADRNGFGDLVAKPETFGLETNPFNFDYPTTQKAYTAGDGGYPVGDLNWFPTRKAAWLQSQYTSVEGANTIATSYELSQNYPNPFNPTTQIRFSLPKADKVSLTIYNALGQEIARLVDGQHHDAGTHTTTWNGRDAAGNLISSGVYFYQLQAGNTQITQKMIMVK